MVLSIVKVFLYLASIFLLGAGFFYYFLDDPKNSLISKTRLNRGVIFGGLVLLFASPIEIVILFINFLGYTSASIIFDYMQDTGHGRSVALRVCLALILMILMLVKKQTVWHKFVFISMALAVLASFSFSSHGASVGGPIFMGTDFVHYLAATLWGGSVIYLALTEKWQDETVHDKYSQIIKWISKLGLAAVITLITTGAYTSLSYMSEPKRFASSPYGIAFFIKVSLVLITVLIAAYNRFYLSAVFLHTKQQLTFRNTIRAEAILLVIVFGVTGVLTSSTLPHSSSVTILSAWQHLYSMLKNLF